MAKMMYGGIWAVECGIGARFGGGLVERLRSGDGMQLRASWIDQVFVIQSRSRRVDGLEENRFCRVRIIRRRGVGSRGKQQRGVTELRGMWEEEIDSRRDSEVQQVSRSGFRPVMEMEEDNRRNDFRDEGGGRMNFAYGAGRTRERQLMSYRTEDEVKNAESDFVGSRGGTLERSSRETRAENEDWNQSRLDEGEIDDEISNARGFRRNMKAQSSQLADSSHRMQAQNGLENGSLVDRGKSMFRERADDSGRGFSSGSSDAQVLAVDPEERNADSYLVKRRHGRESNFLVTKNSAQSDSTSWTRERGGDDLEEDATDSSVRWSEDQESSLAYRMQGQGVGRDTSSPEDWQGKGGLSSIERLRGRASGGPSTNGSATREERETKPGTIQVQPPVSDIEQEVGLDVIKYTRRVSTAAKTSTENMRNMDDTAYRATENTNTYSVQGGIQKQGEIEKRARGLMSRSSFLTKQIISQSTARSLGFVAQIWVHPQTWKIGVLEVRSNLLFGLYEGILLSSIAKVGDVLLVSSDSALEGDIDFSDFHILVGSDLVTEEGCYLGKVRDYNFSLSDGAVSSINFDSFGLPLIPATVLNTYSIGITEVLEAEPDILLVRRGAENRVKKLTKGILSSWNQGSEEKMRNPRRRLARRIPPPQF